MCVCVCVCERERERERDRQTDRDRQTVMMKETETEPCPGTLYFSSYSYGPPGFPVLTFPEIPLNFPLTTFALEQASEGFCL